MPRPHPAERADARDRTPHRPERQDTPPGGRPRPGRCLPSCDRALRGAGACARAHPHLPADPARAVERAGRRARRRAGRRRTRAVLALSRSARAARRHRRDDGPVRPPHPLQAPGPRTGADLHRPARAGGDPPLEKGAAAGRGADRPRHRGRAPVRARADQADAAEAGLVGRGPRRLRGRRGAPHRAGRGRLGAAAVPEAGRRGVLARRLGRRGAALQSPARRWSGPVRWPRPRRPR